MSPRRKNVVTKSLTMNCVPLLEMIRGETSGVNAGLKLSHFGIGLCFGRQPLSDAGVALFSRSPRRRLSDSVGAALRASRIRCMCARNR
jgi:hypothetical protein